MPIPFKIIKKATCFALVLAVFGCNHAIKQQDKKNVKQTQKIKPKKYKEINYTEPQLIAFFDSVGKLPVEPLMNEVAFYADSVFEHLTEPMSRVLSSNDFALLKNCISKGMIKASVAKNIFGELRIDTNCNASGIVDSVKKGSVYLRYFPFDSNKNKFDEFGILLSDSWSCKSSQLYFFKGNKIIAKQIGSRQFNDDVEYFKNVDGESIIYREFEFTRGSGIWWNNYFFYKYDGDKLIPVLNEAENCNAQAFWGMRVLWLESKIQKTNPLTMKMVYHQQFYNDKNDVYFNYGPEFINDSTIVKYVWDEKSKALRGQFQQSKLTQPQILSYYLADNDYLFINSHYVLLQALLKDKKQKPWLLDYLNKIKNYYNRVGTSASK